MSNFLPKTLQGQPLHTELEKFTAHAIEVVYIMEQSVAVVHLGNEPITEDILVKAARHQSDIASKIRSLSPKIADNIRDGFSKWAVLNPMREKAVHMLDTSMAAAKVQVIDWICAVANDAVVPEMSTRDLDSMKASQLKQMRHGSHH